jgi:hypothetical protein
MKCWKSAFRAQGSRLIIVALQVGAVKMYAAIVQALKKKERQGEIQFTTKLRPPHPWMRMFLIFLNLTLVMIKLRVLVLLSLLYRQFYYISLMTRPSCKVIWISCGCIFWWFFFLAMGDLAGLFSKTLWILPPQVKIIFLIFLDCYIFTLFYWTM